MRFSTSEKAARKLDAAMARVERKRLRLAAKSDRTTVTDLQKHLMRLWTLGSSELVGDWTAAKALCPRLQTLLEECRRTLVAVDEESLNSARHALGRDLARYLALLDAWFKGGPIAFAREQILKEG